MVRRAAVALGHIGGEAARAALRDYVSRGTRTQSLTPSGGRITAATAPSSTLVARSNPRTLQAVTRALGYLQDAAAVPLLAETIIRNSDPPTANLFLAEAAVEALGRIGTPEAEDGVDQGLTGLEGLLPLHLLVRRPRGACMACHASPVHYFITEALDALGSHGRRASCRI